MRYSSSGAPRALTEEQIDRIRLLREKERIRIAHLAYKFGVAERTIRRALGGYEYKKAPRTGTGPQ